MDSAHVNDLADAPLVPVFSGALGAMKEREAACLAADIPVRIGRETKAGCGSGACGCGGFELLVRAEDVPRVAALFEAQWAESLRREGTAPVRPGDDACPACGHAGPLVQGACADCGLQLA